MKIIAFLPILTVLFEQRKTDTKRWPGKSYNVGITL